jgi:hypothetical protein
MFKRFDTNAADVKAALRSLIGDIFHPTPASASAASADYSYHREQEQFRSWEVLRTLRAELTRRGLGGSFTLYTRTLPEDLRHGWSENVGRRLEELAKRGIL